MSQFNSKNLWGIDLGGTKIEGVILRSAQEPEVIFRDRIPTEADQGYEHIISRVKKMVDLMQERAGYMPEKIGIGTPGTLIPKQQVMKNCNTTALNGKPLKADLEKRIGVKFEIANDANCFALAETMLGVVKEKFPQAKVVFGVIMGTGVGGGLVINGQVINGYHGNGGEWGHNYLIEGEGQTCFCGKRGCNEMILAGPALESYYAAQRGQRRKMKEIVALAEAGTDPVAQQTMERLYENFGRALSVIVNIVDPEVIVIGGGVGNIDTLYTEGVNRIAKYVIDGQFEAPVVKPSLGDSAGVFGAAYLVA